VGIFLLAFGIFLILKEPNGADPMSVFLQGVHLKTGLRVGTINQIMNLSILFLVFVLDRSSIGVASVLYAISVGFFINILFQLYPNPATNSFLSFIGTIGGGVVIGIGTAVFIYADYGAGAVEGLMVYINSKFGFFMKRIRMLMDLSFAIIGFILGGVVGWGTVIAVFTIGPTIEYTLKQLQQIKTKEV
jgi:uncharacterized membrane protein YczE